MIRVAVDSDLLASVLYFPQRCLLELELRSGDVYRYFDVPPHTHAELMTAESKGRYFNANIRNRFRFQHIRRVSSTASTIF